MHGNHEYCSGRFQTGPTKNKKDIGKIKSISDNLNTNQRREARG